ncbi:MAG: hypothetical protein ABW034_01075 [Steroidobacteraceae bacterium]
MSSERRPTSMQDFQPPYSHDETTAERKASAQRRYDEFQAERRKQLDAQASPFNTPEERIRIWEQLHELRLPRDAEHRLVRIIALQTELSVAEVQSEQQRRAATKSVA